MNPKTSEVFDKAYKKLNKKQKLAVDTIEGPVMVIAGPGTGKTTILTLRIANILRMTDTPPSGILAITFTDAGVKAMRMKLREIIGSRADEVRLHTFHGFAASVLAEFSDHVPHLSRSRQITDIEAEDIVRTILKNPQFKKLRPGGEPDYYVRYILGAISESKREAWMPEMVRKHATSEIERIKNDEESVSTRGATKGQLKAEAKNQIEKCEKTILFSEVCAEYEKQKKEQKKIDFDDLIFELGQALRTDELLLRLLQEKFLYIMVDEHQDTNDAQNLLIQTIATFFDEPNLFIVGDEKQAIYRFQGASVANFLKFETIWKSMQVISLEDNYRSHQHILDAGFSLIENNYEGEEHQKLRVKLKAGNGDSARPIELVSAGNTASADKVLINRLKARVGIGQTTAVIVRRNRDLERVATLCEAHGIPAVSERGVNIFEHPIGALFFELLAFLSDPSNTEALAVTFAGGLWDTPLSLSSKYIRLIRSGSLDEVFKAVPTIEKLVSEMSEKGALSYLIFVAEKSGLLPLALKSPLSAEVWRGIIALSTELSSRGNADDPRALINALLAYKVAAESRSVKVLSGSPDSDIRIMTAHGSKGLEYDEVIIPFATEEAWLPRPKSSPFVLPRQKESGDEVLDGRRLFYVALTRARKHVTIITPLEDSTGRMFTPLRFFSEISEGVISRVDVPSASDDARVLANIRGEDKRGEALVTYAQSILLEKGLSVTALNHFLTCPQEFLYKSILKVPEAPSASSEKGNAMHEAIDRVWHLTDKKESTIAETLDQSVRSYFERSLLPAFEKESLLPEFLETLP
ncbi:ATP-dependent helicase, partial [Patescibacteria group bacterium]